MHNHFCPEESVMKAEVDCDWQLRLCYIKRWDVRSHRSRRVEETLGRDDRLKGWRPTSVVIYVLQWCIDWVLCGFGRKWGRVCGAEFPSVATVAKTTRNNKTSPQNTFNVSIWPVRVERSEQIEKVPGWQPDWLTSQASFYCKVLKKVQSKRKIYILKLM